MEGRDAELIGNIMGLIIVLVVVLVFCGILGAIAYYLMKGIRALPQEHQLLPYWAPWLILVPCVNVFANFWIYIQIAKSYEMNAISRNEPPNQTFFAIGIAYAIVTLLAAIPYVGVCFGPISLILLIVFLVQLSSLRARVESMVGPPVAF